jgi:hypothetical protein
LKLLFSFYRDATHWLINRFGPIKEKRKIRSGRWRFLPDSAYAKDFFFGAYWISLRIILQKFIQRSLIRISSEIIEDSYDETTDVLIY